MTKVMEIRKSETLPDRGALGVLEGARIILSDRSRFCRLHRALDSLGNPVQSTHGTAVKWDLIGAIRKAADSDGVIAMPAIAMVFDEVGSDISAISDRLGHEGVVNLLSVLINRERLRLSLEVGDEL